MRLHRVAMRRLALCTPLALLLGSLLSTARASSCERLKAVHREIDGHLERAGFKVGVNGEHLGKEMEGSSTDGEGRHLCEVTRAARARWAAEPREATSLLGRASNFTVCQTGFNRGRSALAFLAAHPAVRVASFDLGDHPYVKVARNWIDDRPEFAGRHDLYLGNSAYAIPRAVKQRQLARCDMVFVDGNHMEEGALYDMYEFAFVAAPGAKMLIDDCPTQPMVAVAYQRACAQAIVHCPPGTEQAPVATWSGGGPRRDVRGLCEGNYSADPPAARAASRRYPAGYPAGYPARERAAARAAAARRPTAPSASGLRRADGYCEKTVGFSDCRAGAIGSYDQGPASRSLDECVAACRACRNCRFVSFSAANRDCSWFSACDLAHLRSHRYAGGHTYTTVEVRGGHGVNGGGAARSPPASLASPSALPPSLSAHFGDARWPDATPFSATELDPMFEPRK